MEAFVTLALDLKGLVMRLPNTAVIGTRGW